jgi:hypothetical protein
MHPSLTRRETKHQKKKSTGKSKTTTKQNALYAKSKGSKAPMPCKMREETRKKRRYVNPD